jgi:hypothetical protein
MGTLPIGSMIKNKVNIAEKSSMAEFRGLEIGKILDFDRGIIPKNILLRRVLCK